MSMSKLPSGGRSDGELMALVRDGDERAFEQIVLANTASLQAYCRRLGLGHARAEDVIQQSFTSAWLALRRGDEVRELRPWLMRIVHNKAVNVLRSADVSRSECRESWQLDGPDSREPDERLAFRETIAQVAALPDRQREALLLSAVEGHSYEEVARTMDMTPGAVRGLLARARQSLRAAPGAIALPLLPRVLAGSARRGLHAAGRCLDSLTPMWASGSGGTLARGGAGLLAAAALLAGVTVGPLHKAILGGSHAKRAFPPAALSLPGDRVALASAGAPAARHEQQDGGGSGGGQSPPPVNVSANTRPGGEPAQPGGSSPGEGGRSRPAEAGAPKAPTPASSGISSGAAQTSSVQQASTVTAPSVPHEASESPPLSEGGEKQQGGEKEEEGSSERESSDDGPEHEHQAEAPVTEPAREESDDSTEHHEHTAGAGETDAAPTEKSSD
jgi:RNA polymerase sigma factor (sigma-70 family)